MSNKYKKQVFWTLLFKIISVSSSFMILPLMISYFGDKNYGLWSTLLSILMWIKLFDFGLFNSLRNVLNKKIATENHLGAKIYLSSSYQIFGFILLCLFLIVIFVVYQINWHAILNSKELPSDFSTIFLVLFFFMSIQLLFSIINPLLFSLDKSHYVEFIQMSNNILLLIFLFLISNQNNFDFFVFTVFYGLILITTTIVMTMYIYKVYPLYKPNIKFVDLKKFKHIFHKGIGFFILQIAAMIIFTSDKILILQLLGSEHIVEYDIVYKMFSVLLLLQTVLMSPIWTLFTKAYAMKEYDEIFKILKKLNLLMIFIIVVSVIIIMFSDYIISIWIGDIVIPKILIYAISGLFIFQIWNGIYSTFINAIGALKIQILIGIFSALLNIPASIFFVKYMGLGVAGVAFGTIVALSIYALIGPTHTYLILKGKK